MSRDGGKKAIELQRLLCERQRTKNIFVALEPIEEGYKDYLLDFGWKLWQFLDPSQVTDEMG